MTAKYNKQAAAPELLENLQYVESAVEISFTPDDDEIISIHITGKALRDIRTAIAKVEGN